MADRGKRQAPVDPFEQGVSRRKRVARTDLGAWDPKSARSKTHHERDPQALLAASDEACVSSLLPVKRERMVASAFAYFRGAAPVMAYDLSCAAHTGIVVQLCGDAHVQNLGAYSGDDGRLIFDINDFDETIRGPFEWDVKRMATSIVLAGAQAKRVKPSEGRSAAEAFLDSYISLMTAFARLPVLEVARYQVHRLGALPAIAKILGKAERSTPLRSRDQLTEKSKSGARIFQTKPDELWRVMGEERRLVLESLQLYRKSLLPERRHFLDQFEPFDVGFKIVGTGSVGLRDYCVYLEGNGSKDALFLQIKQEVRSAYAHYLPKNATRESHDGQRVADGQRAMQLQSDPFLGWTQIKSESRVQDYLVRQLNDHKASLDVTTLDAAGLEQYAMVCGELLARGHARSGDARVIAGYLGGGKPFQRAMLAFAEAYAEQTTTDWKAFLKQERAS